MIFGGVGVGLYGMLMFAILAVFIAGLMVGRTPEYLGKKIEQYEVKMAMLAVLVLAASILGFAALGANLDIPKEGAGAAAINRFPGTAYGSSGDTFYGAAYNNVNNDGPHGFSMASAKSCMRTRRRPATTGPPSPVSRQTRRFTT